MSGLSSVVAFLPKVTSNAIFSTRRCNASMEQINDNNNIMMGVSNGIIAGGQVRNVVAGLSGVAHASENTVANSFVSAENAIKDIAKGNKIFAGADDVLKFASNHINKLICASGVVSILTAEDKEDETKKQLIVLPTMFLGEYVCKELTGQPVNKSLSDLNLIIENENLYQKLSDGSKKLIAKKGGFDIINSNIVSIKKDGLYKKIPFMGAFLEKQVETINDFCATKKFFNRSLKFVPTVGKGLLFAGASIGSYRVGEKLKEIIFPKTNEFS